MLGHEELFQLSESMRRMENFVRLGSVGRVEADTCLATVVLEGTDGVETPPLAVLTARAGSDVAFHLPTPGERVLVLCPGGEVEAGVIIGSLFASDATREKVKPRRQATVYEDGTEVGYDVPSKTLTVKVAPGGKVVLTADTVAVNMPEGEGMFGVVRQCDTCAFTGGPHPMASLSLKVGK